MDLSTFLYGSFSGAGITTVLVVIIKNPDKVKKWVGILLRGFKTFQYFSIKNEIEGRINSFVGALEAKSSLTQLPRVQIQWTGRQTDKEQIIFNDYEVILVLRDRQQINKNFVHAAFFFTSEVLLEKAGNHISKSQKTALDLFATHTIIESESKMAARQFSADYLAPNINKSGEVKDYFEKFLNIHRVGFFFPILVQELVYLGDKVFLRSASKTNIQMEVRALINYLFNFSIRRVGQINQQIFNGQYTKCAIKIVAQQQTIQSGDISNSKRTICSFARRCESIYIIGSSTRKVIKFVDSTLESVIKEMPQLNIHKKLSFQSIIRTHNGNVPTKTYFNHLRNLQNQTLIEE